MSTFALPLSKGELLVELEIQLQDIHARLTEETQVCALRILGDELVHLLKADASRFGHPCRLRLGRRGADVGVEPASGCGQEIGRNWPRLVRVLLAELLHGALNAVNELLISRAVIGAG